MNPRSIYNIKEELSIFIKEETVDVICVSESWERERETLEKVIQIDSYKVISNVYQRKEEGWRPAIIANTSKYVFMCMNVFIFFYYKLNFNFYRK